MIGRGLVDNPFSADRFAPLALPWFDGDEPLASLVERVVERGAAHQIVGPRGSGKTTLLAHLERGARRAGGSVLRARGSRGLSLLALSRWARRPRPRLLMVDEVEELGAAGVPLLRWIARLARAELVVATHRDVGLPTLTERRVDASTARRIVAHLVRDRALDVPSEAELEVRLARHAGNVRELLFELYDDAERRATTA